MNLHEAAQELRSLNLPLPRQRQLALESAHAPSDDARELLVARARYEAQEGDRRRQEAIQAELKARWAWSQERAAFEPRPVERKPVVNDRPKERPVVVTWTTPRKSDIVRPPRRAEVIGANRTPRTKKVPPKIPEVVEVAKPIPAKAKQVVTADAAPVKLPAGREHGTSAYRDFKCRCEICKKAKADSRTPKGTRAPNGTVPDCGTISGYWKKKCRCDECRTAMSAYSRARYAAKKALEEENRK